MMKVKPLSPKILSTKCKLKQLDFLTTSELTELHEPVGQERAMAAIELGIHIQQEGYNLYLLGPEGIGKHHLINSVLRQQARLQPTANDWCYVNHFTDPLKPWALCLPAGMGPVLQADLAQLITQPLAGLSVSIANLQDKYRDLPAVTAYLEAIAVDISQHSEDLAAAVARYQVNVLVSHPHSAGAPIIYENHPTIENLTGWVEYTTQSGAFTTDFTMIRAGALHQANGGYLILDAQQLMNLPGAWEALKRALSAQQIVIEPVDSTASPHPISLQPQPIPLQIKIILLGDRQLYYSLCEQDTHFSELFKVAADFSNHIPRTPENFKIFARLMATLVKAAHLLPLNRHAVAKMIDHSSRLANDSKRLFIHIQLLMDLLREADYWARYHHHAIIKATDIQEAIDQRIYRANRVETRIHEDFARNIILLDTRGKKIGQINGLSVLQVGHYVFGSPNRITATVRLGKGEVIDIEREVELGGSLHSKGILVLSGFLNGRYLVDYHLSISASLVFEQNYGEVEGDSASAAELAALLSAIAHLPLKQSLAVTGSINQHGQIQVVGNINEKIEGFFAICKTKGFTRQQGVIIPAGNVQHLMLNDEIVEAAKKKHFFIYAVETIDQLMTLLTGLPAGKANKKGRFPENTINGAIERSLHQYAKRADGDHKNN